MLMEIPPWMSRTQLLLGDGSMHKLIASHVLVVGLGGVGGISAEMIVRAGVGRMTIIDADVVEASNRNRQVPALVSTDGMQKADVLGRRLLDINPALDLTIINQFLNLENRDALLGDATFDYAVDCIDTLTPKVHFIKYCLDTGIPIVSSMGAGAKVDPEMIKIIYISVTYNCKLAYYVRKKLHSLGIYNGLKVVFSPERASEKRIVLIENGPKKSVIGTISYMPAIFGCTLASVVIRDLYNKALNPTLP
jgi:tRNA A37 threonylcarbamoyladenosine dehydratase